MSKKRIRAKPMFDVTTNELKWLLPATAEAYEQMVEQMWFAQGLLDHNEVKQQLRAIGITQPKKGRT